MSVCKRAFQTTTTEATNADVCESVFRVITAKVFPSSRFRLKRCDHLHLEEEEISVGRGGGGEGACKRGKKGSMGEGPYEKREVLSKENEGCVFFF